MNERLENILRTPLTTGLPRLDNRIRRGTYMAQLIVELRRGIYTGESRTNRCCSASFCSFSRWLGAFSSPSNQPGFRSRSLPKLSHTTVSSPGHSGSPASSSLRRRSYWHGLFFAAENASRLLRQTGIGGLS